ncbi:MAG: DNA primase [Dehalococcoidales bacterium]|nr:MAG: DNA primase [Dehalococcoidales bacterium]
MSVVDEVKQKLDIVEVIGQYATITKAGRNFRALCPFHSEKRPSFFIYPEQQSWHCFGACNTGGDIFSFIMKKESMDFGEALHFLAQKAGVTITSRFELDTSTDKKEKIYQLNQTAALYFHDLLLNSPTGEKTRDYLASRGLSLETIINFQLGYSLNSWEALKQYLTERGHSEDQLIEAGLILATEDGKTHDRFRNRLIFPIKDNREHVIGFGARVLDESLPKYLNSPQTPVFDKSGSLYGINLAAAAIRQQNLAVIVEGYMDVITAHQNGFNNVIASMGTSVTEKQVNTLKRLTKNIVLALDADAAGEEAMLRSVSYENTLGAEVRVMVMPRDKDPDNVIREDVKTWQQLLDKALPVLDYTFDMVISSLDLNTARDKSLATDRLLPVIAGMNDIVRQAHYLQKLARLVKVSERDLEVVLKKARTAQDGRWKKPDQTPGRKTTPTIQRPFLPSRLEEDCLALLLQYPELKERSGTLLPEYFQNSENREIFTAWHQSGDLASLKDKLDESIHEHVDYLANKNIPTTTTNMDKRYDDYTRRLKERFLRDLEAKREERFALEVELGGSGADLTRLEEEGIEASIQLREVFTEKLNKGSNKGDKKWS